MKLSILAVTALAPFALAYSVKRAQDLSQRDVDNAVPMTFTGPLTVGGPNVTFTGSAESVYAQLLERNPKYDPWEFPEYQARMKAQGMTRAKQDKAFERHFRARTDPVSKREQSGLSKRDYIECNPAGNYVGNYYTQCSEGFAYLARLNGYCGAPKGWGGCSRCSCSHNCGIFLCNDNPFPINVWCPNLAGDFLDIANECAVEWGDLVVSLKGQIFRDQYPGWNTVVKDQSC